MEPIENSLSRLLSDIRPEDRELVRKAFQLADRLHRGQNRVSGEPYITHPLAVAQLLADLGLDTVSIMAGLLHDTLEDTAITAEELRTRFPADVAAIVEGVTKIGKVNFSNKKEAQTENLRKMVLAMARDIRVVIVKLCDRLHNMRTLGAMAEEKRREIAGETLNIYAPLANRLGMTKVKVELEDTALRYLHPEVYRDLTRAVARKKNEREKMIDDCVQHLRNTIGASIPNLEIYGRSKHFYSIYKKMQEDGLSIDEIYDLNAVRIICESETQCYEILGMIHGMWRPIPGRIKDYIALPKENMYQSLHTTVIGLGGEVTEVQIRTRKMHEIAEYGIAAHWQYKESGGTSKASNTKEELILRDKMSWLRQLTEWVNEEREPGRFLESLKTNLFDDVVICFTPKGDVFELPTGATPIDFAYAVHTKVGDHCVGAKVNKAMSTLRTALRNGDVVEILTSQQGHPSRDWLDVVVTARARSKIKHWLKSKELSTWVDSGRASIMRLLEERKVTCNQAELDVKLKTLLSAFRMATVDDLLAEVGFRSISPHAIFARLFPDWVKEQAQARSRTGRERRRPKRSRGPILVEGMEDAEVVMRIAACCSPVPGDDIVGYITHGRGITIHGKDCPSVNRRGKAGGGDGERIVRAYWNNSSEDKHTIPIRIECEDRTGILNDLTGIFKKHGVFIQACHTRSYVERRTANLRFDVDVRDKSELKSVMAALRLERGVTKVERSNRPI